MAGNRRKGSHEKEEMGPQDQSHDRDPGIEGQTSGGDLPGAPNQPDQYYRWRDQFLANASQVFDSSEKKTEKLTKENANLRRVIGDLTVELKKTEEWLR